MFSRLQPLLLIAPIALMGCRIQAAGTPTPTPGYYDPAASPTPGAVNDNPDDDDLTILSIAPVDGARYLPSSFQIIAEFSEPYLGLDGEIFGRFGPTCESGVILRPQISDDRTQVTWSMSATPGEAYCFDLTVYSNLNNPPNKQATWETAPCGVSFDAGQGARFASIGGETQLADTLNQAMERYHYPLFLGLPGVAKADTFPMETEVILSAMLQVLSESDGEQLATGVWAIDPVEGAASVLTGCDVQRSGAGDPWELSCQASELTLPINLAIGSMLNDGTVVKDSEAALLRVAGARLSAEISDSGAINTLSGFTLSGAISQADLEAMAEAAGGGAISGQIDRLEPDADTDGNGSLDGYSIILLSDPVWIPTLGCSPAEY